MKKIERYEAFFVPDDFKRFWLVKYWKQYTEMPVNFIEFCLSPNYLWLWEDIYDSLLDMWYQVFESWLTEVVILAWIGSWKSFFAQVGTVYIVYKLLCLKDPHGYLWLARDKPIEMINMWLNATQAKDVIFTWIRNLIAECKWFSNKMAQLGWWMDILKTEISFFLWSKNWHHDSNQRFELFKLISWNSQETAPIGRNLYAWWLDEAAFYMENSETSVAENIYDAINARIASRFWQRWMTFVISSPKFENDFVARKYEEWVKNPDLIFTYRSTTWHFKDRNKMSDEVFVFDHKNFKIIDAEDYNSMGIKLNKTVIEELKFNDEKDRYLWVIPMDYYKAFKKSPEKATRDLWAKIIWNIEWFIKTRSFIDTAIWKIENKVDEYWIWHTQYPMSWPLFIHIDLALNRTDKSDCAGIAVSRVKWLNKDWLPIIQTVFAEQIHREEWETEIQLSNVRRRVIDLKKSGWEIWLVTLDWYQSVDTMQILATNWIKADYLSLDTSLEPYEVFREALYDERLELPKVMAKNENWWYVEVLKPELQGLELVNWSKVDHPKTWSKDVSDAVAGSVYNAIKHWTNYFSTAWVWLIRRK